MFNRILKVLGVFKNRKKPCKHEKNYNQVNWVASDGTLMTQTLCLDCHHVHCGHVYGEDNDDWACRIAVRDGKLINKVKENEP